MKAHSLIAECIVNFAANGYTCYDADDNKCRVSAELSQDDITAKWIAVTSAAGGEELQGLVNDYNETVGKRVCNVGLIKRVHGGKWQVEDEWLNGLITPENADSQCPTDCEHPISWTIDNKDYRLAIFLEDGYREGNVRDLEDLAEYLNACVMCDNDPCYYVSDWCEEHGCVYNPKADGAKNFTDEDFAYDEGREQVLTLNDKGKFVVRDIED